MEMVFIRAPIIEQVGPDVEVLATDRGQPVLVRQGRLLIATFHPELSDDSTVHEYFLRMAAEKAVAPASSDGAAGAASATPTLSGTAGAPQSNTRDAAPSQRGPLLTSPAPRLKRVIFVCIGNACRSQMAEAIAKKSASDVIAATSAGISPLGYVPSETRTVLREKGVSCAQQTSKPLLDSDLQSCDLVINMTGYPSSEVLEQVTLPMEDWDVGDPYGSDLAIYRSIRDEVQRRVDQLAARLRKTR